MSESYPAHREADVVLRDGSTAQLRPVRPDDVQALREFFDGLDPASQAFRFFSGAIDTERAAQLMASVDYRGHYGLIASRGADHRPIGHGTYIEIGEGKAEVAFAVADELQGHGLGTILLAHLAEAASDNGFATFLAEVLPQNQRMIEMFRESGFPVEIASSAEGLRVEFPTSLSPEAIARFEDRDRLAAQAAVARFVEPASIAVIGASRHRGTVGGEVLHNLIASPFAGSVFAVNRAAESVQSLAAFASVAEIPAAIDLAVLAVDAEATIEVARECAAKGARGLIVLSAGFAEHGPEGARRERELLAVCREAGMRLIGPNCLGVLDTRPQSGLNVTFAPTTPPAGNVGFATQSGALGLALIDFAQARSLGVSSFASLGNRADITANDLLEFWETDERTRLALLYIESFSDSRRFARVARRVGKRKPVIVVKSGRSVSGARAASSHTGALLAASDRTTDALFEQSGVIRAETLAELLDVASLLSSQPLPTGPRVAILTNAGGPGIMCADACEAAGLEVPPLPESVQAELAAFLPAEASLGNPVDMIATASAEQYRGAIAALAAWEGIDALIAIFIRPLLTEAEDVAAAVREAANELPREIPVQAVFMSSADSAKVTGSLGIPAYQQPEDAARALGKAARHARWREHPDSPPPSFPDLRPDEGAAILAEALAAETEWLGAEECARLLDCYGIAMPEAISAADPVAAGRAAAELGGPVALKAHGPRILHKSELGAVRIGLSGTEQVEGAAMQMDEALAAKGLERASFLVQRMIEGGVELLVGVATDPVFGPVVACGAGGTAVELLGDVSVRVCPLLGEDAAEMVASLAIAPMLDGFRGLPPVDREALQALVARVGALAEAHREIVELDLNPVLARADGATALDARIRIAAPQPQRSWPRTWA
ncbi:MAG TPA: GNAT family N-acetyltransferase [Solirubrobacterales bacterium]|nr:GNAT family N-acetyltransferase [Solirubrobacterales bacterium]